MKIKAKLISSIAVSAGIVAGLLTFSVYAKYYYGTEFRDKIPSVTTDYYDLPEHNYIGNDIGASYIYVTAPSNVKYYLSLHKHNLFWNDKISNIEYECQTAGLGGSCYWNSISSNGKGTTAYISITRDNRSNTTTLGGYIKSRARTWK